MTKKLYKFNFDCGRMGDLEGLFIADEEQAKQAIGQYAYFGEVLGKYSEIEGAIEEGDISIVDVSEATMIELFNIMGENVSGYNPLDYICHKCKSCEEKYDMDEISYISNGNAVCDYCVKNETHKYNYNKKGK